MIRRRWYLLVAVMMIITACGDGGAGSTTTAAGDDCSTTSPALHESGKLTVATGEPVFPPWMIDDDPSNGEGFESAVVYALAEKLGFAKDDVQWVRTTFDEAIAAGDRDYDFNIQQYSIRPDRAEIVSFSNPYYTPQKSLLALSGTPAAEAGSIADLKDVRFGATIGTTDLDYIENFIQPNGDVAVYDTQGATLDALQGGLIDATVVSLPGAFFITAVQVPEATIVGVLPRQGEEDEGLGLLFTKDNPYVSCVNTALQAITSDGTLARIGEEWLQGDGEIPEIEG